MGRTFRGIAIGIIIMLLLGILAVCGVVDAVAQEPYPQPTGFAVISGENNWNDQRQAIRAGGATFVRLPITQGFGNWPEMVDDLISDGVTHIALQTRDCNVTYENVYRDLIDQAFQLKVHHNQHIQFYLEVGNEPDICGSTAGEYRSLALGTLQRIKPLIQYPNLQFILGLGVHPEYNRTLLGDGTVLANFDGVAYHIYAHGSIGDIPETYNYYRDELAPLDIPVLLTEVGINGDIGTELKAQRYREFALNPPGDPEAIAFWTTDPEWKGQYHIDIAMAQDIGGATCFPETGHCISGAFQDFYQRNGLDLGDPGISGRESILLWGYPLSDPFIADTGRLTQVFERMVFEYHPEQPEPYKVLLRRMGAERCEELCPR